MKILKQAYFTYLKPRLAIIEFFFFDEIMFKNILVVVNDGFINHLLTKNTTLNANYTISSILTLTFELNFQKISNILDRTLYGIDIFLKTRKSCFNKKLLTL